MPFCLNLSSVCPTAYKARAVSLSRTHGQNVPERARDTDKSCGKSFPGPTEGHSPDGLLVPVVTPLGFRGRRDETMSFRVRVQLRYRQRLPPPWGRAHLWDTRGRLCAQLLSGLGCLPSMLRSVITGPFHTETQRGQAARKWQSQELSPGPKPDASCPRCRR